MDAQYRKPVRGFVPGSRAATETEVGYAQVDFPQVSHEPDGGQVNRILRLAPHPLPLPVPSPFPSSGHHRATFFSGAR